MAAIAKIIKNRIILRAFFKLAGIGTFFLLPTLCLDYSNINTNDVKANLNIQIYFLRFCIGIGMTIITKSEDQRL